MDNVGFGTSGEEIERALMDLGPLLGVTIKEETPEELPDPGATVATGATVAPRSNVASASSGSSGTKPDGESADSLDAGAVITRCVLCQTDLAQAEGTPKLMECLHSACETCIRTKIEEKQSSNRDFLGAERITVQCPKCRLQCQPSNMIDQRFVLEKMTIDQSGTSNTMPGEQQCNSCDDTEPATSYCVECAEFICDNCVHAHQRLKITKDHTIKSKEEALSEQQAAQAAGRSAHDMLCADHPQERLSLFCETCDRLTCRDCQLQHHRDHKYQFSAEMAAQARANITSLLSEVNYKRVLLGSAMKVIRDRQQLIADKKKALVHEITQTVVKLTNAINTRGKQLVLRLNEVCDSKQRTLSEKKDALEQLAGITDHCVAFVNQALDQGSDTAVLYSKRAVCAHLQRIKCRRADIPNPEIPVRIALALDKLPDLIKVLSSIGAIVVDGKVDGGSGAGGTGTASGAAGAGGAGAGGGSAQGPYHPPAAPHPSAVVALQHVAMQQTLARYQPYASAGAVGGVSGVGAVSGVSAVNSAAYMSALQQQMRQRPQTLLRHPHVTSTTHPHHLHGMNEMNLRGLLNASGQRGAAPGAPGAAGGGAAGGRQMMTQQQHAQHVAQQAYQQMLGAYGAGAFGGGAANSGRRSGTPRTPSPAPLALHHHHQQQQQQHQQQQQQQHQQQQHQHLQQHQQHSAKWHIPQHAPNAELQGFGGVMGLGEGGAEFKITLGRRPAPAVTSTNPKTPSPSLNGGVNLELDKVCAESVQDLMATIAKLDSNGVQVLREHEPAPSPAPPVHSSTDTTDHGKGAGVCENGGAASGATGGAADPNEDWCAVCMDGGELMCCDKCPKVFHQYCHIPTIEKLPDETETWQCLLCVNFAELRDEDAPVGGDALSPRQQKLVERITLELYCQYETSLPFREPVPVDNVHYHSRVPRPMCLDMIRQRLQPSGAAPAARYTHVAQFVADCRLMFRNARHYNTPDSQIYKDAERLEQFFNAQLMKWLPEYAYWSGEGEPPAKRARTD